MYNYNYDLKDEDTYYWINQLCLSDQPIPFYNINIYIPNMKDIMALKPSCFNSLCIPFSYSKDCFDVFRDIKIFNTLDCFYYSSEKDISLGRNNIFYTLLYAISFFTKINIKNIKYYNNKENNGHVEIVIEDLEKVDKYNMPFRFCLDGNKFDELASIIRLICNLSLLTKEDMEKMNKKEINKRFVADDPNMDKRIQEFYEGRRRFNKIKEKSKTKEEKAIKLFNIYQLVSNNWKSFDKVNELNIYQLNNVYSYYNANINFKTDISIATSGFASEKHKIRDIRLEIAK